MKDNLTPLEKRLATIIERYGSMEAYRNMLRRSGAKGGKAKGASKRRGDSDYYAKLGSIGGRKQRKRKKGVYIS